MSRDAKNTEHKAGNTGGSPQPPVESRAYDLGKNTLKGFWYLKHVRFPYPEITPAMQSDEGIFNA